MTADPPEHEESLPQKPGRPRDEQSHAAILESTLDMLLETGYTGVTMEEVARRAGVGKATIYRWWDSKLDLVLEAAAPHLEIGSVPNTGSTRGDLRAAMDQVITTYADPVAAMVIFVVIADLEKDARMRDIFRSTWVLPWRRSLAAAIERAKGRGDVPARLDTPFIIDILVGTVFQRVLIVPEPETEGLADHLVDLVLEGTLPETGLA